MGKEIFLLETKEGLMKLLDFIESSFEIKYIRAGLLDEHPKTKNSLTDKLELGIVDHKDWNFNEKYLILKQNDELHVREVPQKKGGIKYAIDQMKNADSLIISLGGYNKTENAIIASKITTKNNTSFTNLFFKKLNEFLKANNKKVESFYIGADALIMAKEGTRLTEDARLEETHDISA
ncbi:hypothetical protein D2V93_02250 [Flagellimonas taeanensis]|uniref:hypothetical protein n=1 Tax=Flavobacteriaceae TaxID=49546 RepID=UPI000E695602|nr:MULTISPECIES: hypothetical protein [Allomuricauda]MDC6384617.1 hypothetical protein [Muricauda sp. SK9]MDC6384626.1 hypothetical protein [Muricauda sp. SK9]RIV51643.1 hypothetical protein D2V93_06985 [Allomuricauda taeanensis]RIV53627.1 hypothetical protein D2V93_02250 [Allomuricauda taeanensis]